MASIDHTDIVFKNGEWVKETWHYDENDKYMNDLPFEYGRDGNIHTINGVKIHDKIKWYHDEYDAIYERDGWRYFYTVRKSPVGIWEWLKYKLRFKHKVCYRKEVGVYKDDNVELYIYHDPLNTSYASFYYDGTDTYVVLGGYGHWGNVYTHFMHRGYGDEFEEKMVKEAYHWLCNKVLRDIVDDLWVEDWDENGVQFGILRRRFAKCDDY